MGYSKKDLLNKVKIPNVAYSKWADVNAKMGKLVYTWIDAPAQGIEAPAYCTRDGKLNECYKVWIETEVPEARETFMLHEFGHAIYQHLRYEGMKTEQVKNRIKSKWTLMKKSVDMSEVETASEEKTVRDALCSRIMNIAMDMEVNSKTVAADERDGQESMVDAYSLIHAVNSATTQEELEQISKFFDTRAKDPKALFAKGVWPKDYGFSDGLDWMTYLNLMLMQPEKTMKDLMKNMSFQDVMMSKGSGQGKGSGNGKGKSGPGGQNGKGSGSGSGNGKIPAGYFAAKEKSLDTAAQEKQDAADKAAESAEAASSGYDGTMSGRGTGHGNDSLDFDNAMSIERKTKQFLLKNCIAEAKLESHSDPLYNYNRGKSGDVIIPKMVCHQTWVPGNMYVLVDVSGSVPAKAVAGIIKELKAISNKVGDKSKIILWDDDFCGEHGLKDKTEFEVCGCHGGTTMSTGIQYIFSKYIKLPKDKLFVVSDFEDELEDWVSVLNTRKCEKYAIRWHYNDDKSHTTKEVFDNYKSYHGNCGVADKEWDRCSNELKTLDVVVER